MENLSGQFIKGYELGERIGAGGFGAVYKAYQSTVGREVAIKIILPHFSNHPDFIRRFETEAHLIARLEHLHIIPLYDYWRDADGAYLVMRWFRGGSLRDALQQASFAPEAAATLMDQVASALSMAHRSNVIHRDLKPGNILLDEDSNAYLADFGIAKDISLQNGVTEIDAIVGSPDYLAPEQARAEPVTPATDIYSLGVVLYEVLHGQHPFPGVSAVERLYKHLNEPLPLITTLPVSIADDVNAVIQKATAKDPQQRFADSLQVATAFRQAIHGTSSPNIVEMLTPREQDILQLIIEGQSNKQIADKLVVTIMTVKWYITQIYRKLGVRSRVQAMVRARELNLITGIGSGANMSVTRVDLPLPSSADLNLPNPYKGLRAFQPADHQDFFGREKITAKLLKRLSETGEYARFLAVIGPSGSGKSSLVKAGLIPALWRGELPGAEKWFIVEMLPGANPLDELEVALTKVATNKNINLNEHLRRDKRGLLRAAELILPNDGSDLLLVIDQFEEVFTLVEDEQERMHFLELILAAVSEPRSRIRLLVTLRADFYDRPLHYSQFGELVRSRMETVLPMSAEELERAITRPAERIGVVFEPGLVAAMVAEINYQPGALPLLQYALTELFEQRQRHLLTHDAYQIMGKTVGALAKRADEIYLNLSNAGQEAARQMFLRLVTLGEGVEDTRRRTLHSEVLALNADTGLMEEVIDAFADYRLLSLDNDPGTRSPTIEVAHEAILREWERLRVWLNDSRDEIRLQRQLAVMTAEWRNAGQDTSFLARGTRLDTFEKWADETQLALTPMERNYLHDSFVQRDREQKIELQRQAREKALEQRAVRFLRGLVAVLLIAILGAVVLTAAAFSERDNAQDNFLSAERIRLASQAQLALNRGEGGDVPALLALRSIYLGYTPEADAALLNALTRGFARQIYRGHSNALENVMFSADGLMLLTAGGDNTARLWNVQTGQELQRFYQSSSWLGALSPDGRYVITGGLDGSAVLWDAASGEELHRFGEFSGGVNWVDFSPDSQTLVVTNGNRVSLWNMQNYQLIQELIGHTDKVYVVRFSSDGRHLISGSVDNTARLWDLTTGETVQEFIGHTDCTCGASISPDGRYVATASLDQTARLWDVASGQELKRFIGHTDALYEIHFSPDGRYLLTPSLDKTVRLWDIASGQEVRRFIGHTASVNQAVFSPDGQYIVTASSDRTARLWEVTTEVEPRQLSTTSFTGHDSYYFSAVLSRDNRFVLTGSGDGRLRRWDLVTGNIIEEIALENIAALSDLDISADAEVIVTGDINGTARLWDSETGHAIYDLKGHTAAVVSVAFSPDGRYVLTGSNDNSARLWDVETGTGIREFIGHSAPVLDSVFSSDGKYVLTGSSDGTARLWETQSGREIHQFSGNSEVISTVAISPDGAYVLTGSNDRIARLWDIETGKTIREFIGHTDQVRRVTFSPDGHYALTGSGDQTVRLWDVNTGQEVRRLVGHLQPIDFVGFSSDGQYIMTGDRRLALIWRTHLEDVIAYACTHLSADLNANERTLYNIKEDEPICPEFRQTSLVALPTWTPFDTSTIVQATMPALVTRMEFYSDIGNVQMGFPMQDVYVAREAPPGVMRLMELNDEVMELPLYRSRERVPQDYEAPIEMGPFPQGEPLGFTVAEWVAAKGEGTYTLQGSRATMELTFENLVPNGLYTLWCVKLTPVPFLQSAEEKPCGNRTGSDSTFTADANGSAAIRLEMDAFPPSTSEFFYEVAAAYHSDGRTYGPNPGDFGRNVHAQLFYDFLPPGT